MQQLVQNHSQRIRIFSERTPHALPVDCQFPNQPVRPSYQAPRLGGSSQGAACASPVSDQPWQTDNPDCQPSSSAPPVPPHVPRSKPHKSLADGTMRPATQELSACLPNDFPLPETTLGPLTAPHCKSRTPETSSSPWRPFLGGLLGLAACAAGYLSHARRHGGSLFGGFRPGNRYHSLPLFIRQSQRECTLVAKPVVLDVVRWQASPVRPPQPQAFERFGLYQEKCPLTQLAEGYETS
jgi:hypothetical protein